MSHTSTYAQKITNIALFCDIARRKGYQATLFESEQNVGLYGRNTVKALASVKIAGWQMPLAITAEGEVKYDHFGSKMGTMELLGELCQNYNEEVILSEIPYEQVENVYTEWRTDGLKAVVIEYE